MGQLIEVEAMNCGDVAVFSLDRSLTGQDAWIFRDSPDGDQPPRTLARRLWERPGDIDSVHVLSNAVTVSRQSGWDQETLAAACDVIANLFVHWEHLTLEEYDEQLRDANYNATVTSIRKHNPDLWVMRVTPDEPIDPFEPGKYTTLGLGFWEPRADHVTDDFSGDPEQREKMARRSYSVSSSMLDENGDLVAEHPDEIEFYIVQVPPDEEGEDHPDLTPRIFALEVGDRIYMSRKFTGRYTLEDVEPGDNVVFLSTGTGEAPQNIMVAELLRRGHQGRILSVVTVRYKRDLAYLEDQARVEEAYPNYEYVALTTREPENEGNKVYIQDYIESGQLEETLGAQLDPDTTHVFLCGNPLMIGLPRWDDDGEMTFPETRGVCEILHERGFTIDHLRERGNVHYEEYWKER
jgi:ferredoxin--NADP+ reductase